MNGGTAGGGRFVKVETKWAGGSDWTMGGVSDWAVGLAVVGTRAEVAMWLSLA